MSTDKMSRHPCFFLRQAVFFLAQGNALHEKAHVFGQRPHGLKPFGIFPGLTDFPAVHAVPILAGSYGHTADAEVFVQLIVGGRKTATAGNNHACSHLHCLVKTGTEEYAVKIGNESGICRSIIDRRAHNNTITLGKEFPGFIHHIIKNTLARFKAFPATNAATDSLDAYLHQFRLDALCLKDLPHLLQSQKSIALHMGDPFTNITFIFIAPYNKTQYTVTYNRNSSAAFSHSSLVIASFNS